MRLRILKALLGLVRVRYTAQVVGIVSVLSIKSNGITTSSFLAITAFLFLCIALFSYDDAHDHVSDAIAHSKRPIPQGVFTPNQVHLIGSVFLLLGILVASALILAQLLVFLVIVIIGFAVIFVKLNPVLRATFNASMIFLLFPFTSMRLEMILFGLIVALPHIGGSLAKDFLHSKGDETIGLQPPLDWARYLSSFIFFMSSGIILLPIVLNLLSWVYIPLIFPTLLSSLILGRKFLSRQYKRVYIYGGIGMVSTLVAFALTI